MKIIYYGNMVVKSSGATIKAQLWQVGSRQKVWDGLNWYSAEAFVL